MTIISCVNEPTTETHVHTADDHDATGNGSKEDQLHQRLVWIEVDDHKVGIKRVVVARV